MPINKKSVLSVAALILSLFTVKSFADNSLMAMKMAQTNFINRDKQAMFLHLKEALMESRNHPFMVRNAALLLNQLETQKWLKDYTPDWKVPEELKYLNVSVNRKYLQDSGRVRFFLSAGGQQLESNIVEDFQVIRYPNEVVIDKNASNGKWNEQLWAGQPTFWISEDWHAEPVAEGLYLLNIKVKNKALVQGWFFISNENSSASPVIKTPISQQVYRTDQPTFVWKKFVSPERSAEDRVKVGMKVSREDDKNYEDLIVVNYDLDSEKKELSFRVGERTSVKEYQGLSRLTSGNYFLTIGYRELHNYGDLWVGRVSSSKVPFIVEQKP